MALLDAAAAGDLGALDRLGARREELVRGLGYEGLPRVEVSELANAIRRVLALDAQVLAALQAQRAAVAAELNDLHTGRQALRGYRASASVPAALDAAG